jgi:hypothetical protein
MPYEPKNRLKSPLPVLEIRITTNDGVYTLNPNSAAVAVVFTVTGEKVEAPMVPETVPNILDLEPVDGIVSEISGKPAVIYAADDIELKLSVGELLRFMNKSLETFEFKYLLKQYGMFFEIHDDFYDPRDGALFQPMFEPEEIDQALLRKVERLKTGSPSIKGP